MTGPVLARPTVELLGDDSSLAAAVARAEGALNRAGERMQRVGAALSVGLSLPILAIGTAATKAAIKFESSFAGIRKTMDLTEDQFGQLAAANRQLAKEIPVAVDELNRIGELAGQLGIRGVANVLKFEDTIAKLAVTTDLTAEQGALAFAQIANVLQLPQDQIDRLGAAVVGLGNNFATVESQIVEFTSRIAGAGKIAGVSAGSVAGIGAAFASLGVNAEAGGTAVQKVLISMVTAVATGNADLTAFAQTLGVTSEAFKQAFRADATATFVQFVEALGVQGERAITTLEALGLTDQRLTRSFLAAAGAGDLLRRAVERGNTEFAKNTALNDEAAKRFKTTESQLTLLRNRLNDVAITFGTALLPTIKLVVENALVPFIETLARMATAFSEMPRMQQIAVLTFTGIAAAIGPVLLAVGSLIKLLPIMQAGFLALSGAALAPVLVQLAAIAAVVFLIADAFENVALDSQIRQTEAYTKALAGQVKVRQALLKSGLDFETVNARMLEMFGKQGLLLKPLSKSSSSGGEDPEAMLKRIRAALGGITPASDDAQKAIERFSGSLASINAQEQLLGGNFDAVSERASAYRNAIEELTAAGVSFDAKVGPQGQTLRELAQTYIGLEGAINANVAAADAFNKKWEKLIAIATGNKAAVQAVNEQWAALIARGQEAMSMIDGLRTPVEQLEAQMAALVAIQSRFLPATFNEAMARLQRLLELAKLAADPLRSSLVGIASAGIDAFASFATGAGNAIRDFVQQALRDLARLALRFAAFKVLSSFFPGSGTIIEAITGFQARAMGGPVQSGRPYLVGERGPELFVPHSAGRIHANASGGGGGTSASKTAASILAALPPTPGPLPPEVAATHDWYRRLLGAMAKDGIARGVRFA